MSKKASSTPKPRKLGSKIKAPAGLKRVLAKRGRKRVVFTNGCFDLLHPGHVRYLESARAQGDLLVVALNTDASVSRLKGPSRPVNALEDRLQVMAALECVDFVTWFGEDDPLAVILQLKPNVLVKGGDWKIEDMIGGKEVLSWGGKVKSLRYIEGKSTTQILAKANERNALK